MKSAAIGIIQARLASTRLPGKLLAPLAGRPLFEVMFERIKRASVSEWWLATTSDPSDDITAAWGHQLKLRVHRGDVEDVLSRFTAILRETKLEPQWVVRITADNPFVDAHIVDLLLEQAKGIGPDHALVSENPAHKRLPLGYVPQVARASRVLSAEGEIANDKKHHRSHVLSWLYEKNEVKFFEPPSEWKPRSEWRWTVDTPADLEMTRKCFELFGETWQTIGYPEMERILAAHPEVSEINAHIEQKALQQG